MGVAMELAEGGCGRWRTGSGVPSRWRRMGRRGMAMRDGDAEQYGGEGVRIEGGASAEGAMPLGIGENFHFQYQEHPNNKH